MPYLMGVMAQLLLPCYYGQQLIEVSSKLSMSLFHAHYKCDEKSSKANIKILLELLKKPKKLRAFFIFDISMDIYLRIFNASYSLYAILKSLNN